MKVSCDFMQTLTSLNVTESLKYSSNYSLSLLSSSGLCVSTSESDTGFPLAAPPLAPAFVGLVLFVCGSCLLFFFADAVCRCLL